MFMTSSFDLFKGELSGDLSVLGISLIKPLKGVSWPRFKMILSL